MINLIATDESRMYFNITLLNKLSTSRTIPQPFFRQFFESGPYGRCDLPCEFPNCLRSHRDAKFVPDAPIEKSLLATLAECRLEQLVALLRHWSVEVDTTLDKMGVRLLVGPRNGAAVVGFVFLDLGKKLSQYTSPSSTSLASSCIIVPLALIMSEACGQRRSMIVECSLLYASVKMG
jgi:hypothetical protein